MLVSWRQINTPHLANVLMKPAQGLKTGSLHSENRFACLSDIQSFNLINFTECMLCNLLRI